MPMSHLPSGRYTPGFSPTTKFITASHTVNLDITRVFIWHPLSPSFAERHGVAFAFEKTSDLRLAPSRQPHLPFHLYFEDPLLLALDLDESSERLQAFRHVLSRLEPPGGVCVQRPDLANEPLLIARVGQHPPKLEFLPRVHLWNGLGVRPRVGRLQSLPVYRLDRIKPEGYVLARPGADRQETVGLVVLWREHPHRLREIVRWIDGGLRRGGFHFLAWLRRLVRVLPASEGSHEHDNDEEKQNPYVLYPFHFRHLLVALASFRILPCNPRLRGPPGACNHTIV